ncbi:MAG TPA: efflux RND transporter periplasmic adaptor subunit [Steroidobacteraceae bacterium]|nr:efflux RND transporter periplasmic adaptor subunit [Steroidobacteraceae bacterium]
MDALPTPDDRTHMHGIARTGTVILVLAAGVILWSIIRSHRAAAELAAATEDAAVINVATTHPLAQTQSSELVLPGMVQANYDAPIYARTSGYLRRWLVDIGARVKAGQVLAEIETPEVDQQLRQAEADRATAQANESIAEVTAQRWEQLRRTDSVSRQDADERVSQAAAAKAQLQSAQANVARLKELVGFQRIVAPFDGVITARNTDVGQLIAAGENTGPELFRIADEHRLRLYVRVPQNFAAAMVPSLKADVRFPDRPGAVWPARLDSTASAIDPASGTLLVQLIVDNSKGELLPGAYGEVHFRIPPGTTGESLKVPANVLLFRGDGMKVATVGADGRVVLKAVTVGRDYGSAIEITRGLDPEDNVILSPPDSLVDDVRVRVVPQGKGASP